MERRRYSGYLADDESLRGAQMGNLNASLRRGCYEWRNAPRPPSRCQFRCPEAAASTSTSPTFASTARGKHKHGRGPAGSARESSHLEDEFSEFVDFLADEDVLESLQSIVEDAVRKLRDMTTEEGERLFDIQEESPSSAGSESWSVSYSSTQSTYYTTTPSTTMSSSEEDGEQQAKRKRQPPPEGKTCLLDKYAARLPKLGKKKARDGVSGGFHAQTYSERSGDRYFFRREHFHIWAKLAESFEQLQPPKKDYFAKFRKEVPSQSFSVESLQKEVTSVLKRPSPSSIPLYYPGRQPFDALDFLEEKKILAALQGIINQAVDQVLDMRGADGLPLLNLFDEDGYARMLWESSVTGSEEEGEEEEEGEGEEGEEDESSGSGEETSEEDSKSGGSKSSGRKKKKKKKGKKKGKKKKGKAESPVADEKGKGKYTAPLPPKGRKKSLAPEEQRKAKYVPPPLPKTKPRAPPEEPPPKPKYTPPPLPKPKQKKADSAQLVAEAPKQVMLTKHIITTKDIKRARLQARPLPRQSIIDFLIENAAKLILYKYNYETLLSEKLGLISVPVTKVLLEIMFGYKKVKGSAIRLSSQIDWSKVYDEIYAVRPRKPQTPKPKAGDKKKTKGKKQKGKDKPAKSAKKSVLFKPDVPKGKVVVIKSPADRDSESAKAGAESASEAEGSEGPEIFEIVPPQFPDEEMEMSADEEGEDSPGRPSRLTPKGSGTSTALDSPQKSLVSQESPTKAYDDGPADTEDASPDVSLKKSLSSRRASDSNRGSRGFLPEVEPAGQPSEDLLRKASLGGNGSRTVLPKITN